MLQPSVSGRLRVGGRNVPVDFIANSLGGAMGRPMVDRIGLAGKFDFVLEWAPEIGDPLKQDRAESSGPPVADAVREQLGFKLEPQKAQIPVSVLDRVERPTAN